jgi:chemotaxis protein MotB
MEERSAAVPEVLATDTVPVSAESASPAEPVVTGRPSEAVEDAAVEELPPIIVKKIIDEGHGGAHGGAWKIALADMMTAMMAFFLLMWLLGASNTDQRKSVADYFKPTALTKSSLSVNETSGAQGLLGGQSIIDEKALPMPAAQTGLMQVLVPRDSTGNQDSDKETTQAGKEADRGLTQSASAEQGRFETLQKDIQERLIKDKELAKLADQVSFGRDREGMRIEILDKADFSMFGSGTSRASARAEALIREIARSIAAMPNPISVRGHTDSVPYNTPDRNNWSLSAERAEVTRQVIIAAGVDASRFVRIEGVADTQPFNAKDRLDPRNRRISITLLHRDP